MEFLAQQTTKAPADFDTSIKLAIVSGIISLVVAIGTAIYTAYKAQKLATLNASFARDVALLNASFTEKLAVLNAALNREKSEEDARREYEYEARKRLYAQCEPLLFQLCEAAELAYRRFLNMANAAISGNLGDEVNWLRSGYYLYSTMYRMLAPAAILSLMQQRLTFVDLRLDARTDRQYRIAKQYYDLLTADFDMAHAEPKILYTPNVKDWANLRETMPSRYWRQAAVRGRLDRAVSAMLVNDKGGEVQRLMSFGEFEEAARLDGSQTALYFENIRDLFFEFNPEKRPIFWRVLCGLAIAAQMLRCDTEEVTISDFFREQDVRRITRATRNDVGNPLEVAAAVIRKLALDTVSVAPGRSS